MDDRPTQDTRAGLIGAFLALMAGLIVWLWPIGFGGRMPVGGDVTQFSLGLMAVLARAIGGWRLPIWNDLWGYGFPGLAESQMGVYYPPHLILYGLLPLEAAYTVSLVAHTFWAGMGAFWAARRFGISPAGSTLTGFSWAASGFFVIHIPHQWGYTTGSWMPWAWGLTWMLLSGQGTRRTALLLALVLTTQTLAGHFQLAFYTEVGVGLLSLAALGEPAMRHAGARRGVVAVALAMLAVVPLGAMQLGPTARLAWLAADQRDDEYLSGFAATPVHLVSYVAPGVFQRSPLWRPLAWDPFRTSPEEHLAYVGLVPLFLAMGVFVRQARREPAVRVLGVVALATLILSLGPYVPGFTYLIRLPGFSFFRAPARWSLATELALCLLAGRGFDAFRSWPRVGRMLAKFAVAAVLIPALLIAAIELALAITQSPAGMPEIESFLETAVHHLLPAESQTLTLSQWTRMARDRQSDLRVATALARQGMAEIPASGLSFAMMRRSIYVRELWPTAALVAALMVVAAMSRHRRFPQGALLALTAIDLWGLSRMRHYDLGPIRPLTEQSPILARLAREPDGSRTVDPAKNLSMVARTAPLLAYRTLDLPAMTDVAAYASFTPGDHYFDRQTRLMAAFLASGASLRIFDQYTISSGRARTLRDVPGWESREEVHDPALAGWLFGSDWVAGQGSPLATFTVWRPWPTAARAWLVPLTSARSRAILEKTARTDDLLRVFGLASTKPLEIRSRRPEWLEVTVDVEEGLGEAAVLVTQLSEPQWRGRWIGPNGREQPAAILTVSTRVNESGWQAARVPGPGRWTLRLEYDAADVRLGLVVSGVSFLIWIGLAIFLRPGRVPGKAD